MARKRITLKEKRTKIKAQLTQAKKAHKSALKNGGKGSIPEKFEDTKAYRKIKKRESDIVYYHKNRGKILARKKEYNKERSDFRKENVRTADETSVFEAYSGDGRNLWRLIASHGFKTFDGIVSVKCTIPDIRKGERFFKDFFNFKSFVNEVIKATYNNEGVEEKYLAFEVTIIRQYSYDEETKHLKLKFTFVNESEENEGAESW